MIIARGALTPGVRDSDGRLYYLRARPYGLDNPKRTGSTIAEVSLALDFRCPAY